MRCVCGVLSKVFVLCMLIVSHICTSSKCVKGFCNECIGKTTLRLRPEPPFTGVSRLVCDCDPEPPFTGVSGPSGPKFAKKKSSKRVFLGVPKKVPESNPESQRRGQKVKFSDLFGPFLDLRTFFGTLRKTRFETFLQFWARRVL